MRSAVVVAGLLLLAPVAPAYSAVGVSIGINIPTYPNLVPVPGYPVYYAPGVNSNYFFYDGLYWDFDGSNWYSSAWYNGPWNAVDPYAVPVYLLRVPVRYYHHPPVWFHGWAGAGAPHWHEHWGASWAERRSDWVHWDNHAHMPSRAPLPSYQSRYAGTHYPRVEEQARFHNEQYHYAPREQMVQQHYNEHGYQHAQRVEEHRAVVQEKKEEKREEHHEHR